jgi:hypothetical protein
MLQTISFDHAQDGLVAGRAEPFVAWNLEIGICLELGTWNL